jgi:signal peptidase II
MILAATPRRCGLLALIVALALDQTHKFFMLHVLDIGAREPIRVTPFLDLQMSWNRGISYSMFAANDSDARMALIAMQLAIIAGLTVWMLRVKHRRTALALGLIVGGALGNVLDRIFRGAVADFLYFHTSLPVGPLANYVFNVADAMIFLGVCILLWESLFPPSAAKVGDRA